MSDCPFCAIVAGEAPASVVDEAEDTLAFLDINPSSPGHTLVVPREHADGLADLPADTGRDMFTVGQRVAAALRETRDPAGINFFLADGEAAGQDVFHVHLHVVPRHVDDGAVYRTPTQPTTREELDAVATELRERL